MSNYESGYPLIEKKWDANQLHDFLVNEYDHGLFEFALSLAVIASKMLVWGTWKLWFLKNEGVEYYNKFKTELKELERIKHRLRGTVNQLSSHLGQLNYWDYLEGNNEYPYPEHLEKDETIEAPHDKSQLTQERYRLEETFRVIDSEIQFYKEMLESVKGFIRRKGRSAEIKLLLPAFWSYILKDSDKIHWDNIELLREWFSIKLKGTKYTSRTEVFPPAGPVLEFRRKQGYLLEAETPHFFKEFEDKINPLGLQIDFAEEEPKIGALGESECSKDVPSIKFTDGTTFP